MDLGQAIKMLRTKQQMTQAELAKRVGMSTNAVSQIELGKTMPPKATVERLAHAFGIPISYILLTAIEKEDIPEEKQVLYRALLEPFRNELLETGNLDTMRTGQG